MVGPPRIVPAVSLRAGEVVIVRNHAYEPVEDEQGRPFAIDEFAEVFLKPFDAVLVFDIDGLEGEGAQFDEAGRMDGSRLELWWDAGARDHNDLVAVLTSGAHKAVASTRTLSSLRELKEATELSDSVVFEVVVRDNAVVSAARDLRGVLPDRAIAMGAGAGAEEVLVLDASRPLGSPIDFAALSRPPPSVRALYLGGGIDLRAAHEGKPPEGLAYGGAVVDLISILAPYL